MDGFEYHRDKTDQDSAKRMALVRAGYLVWSLTWHDLETVLGSGDNAPDLLGHDDSHMAPVQKTLDGRWDTGLIRSRLVEPSLTLLVRFLQNPDVRAWKRAMFTDLLRLFQAADMQSAELKRQFTQGAMQLPPALREAFDDLPKQTALAGRGKWRNTLPDFAQLLLALPLDAVETPEPEELIVALHLNDAAQSEHQGYREEWNGVLRLYNLLQFLPNAWWTTDLGVQRDIYPEFAPVEPEPETMVSGEWAESISLAVPELLPSMRELAGKGVPSPEVGFELTNSSGQVVAEAELAWEARQVAVLLPDQDHIPFDEAGWRTLQVDDPALASALDASPTDDQP